MENDLRSQLDKKIYQEVQEMKQVIAGIGLIAGISLIVSLFLILGSAFAYWDENDTCLKKQNFSWGEN
jgi:hypothetical protein